MKTGMGLALIGIGAILAFAVTTTRPETRDTSHG